MCICTYIIYMHVYKLACVFVCVSQLSAITMGQIAPSGRKTGMNKTVREVTWVQMGQGWSWGTRQEVVVVRMERGPWSCEGRC